MDWTAAAKACTLEQNKIKWLVDHGGEYSDADVNNAQVTVVYEGSGTLSFRFEYEEMLVLYNRRLAAAKSECGRLETVANETSAAYDKARERHDGILREFGRRIIEHQASIVSMESEKHRLTEVHRARLSARDAMHERRKAQYEQALDELKANMTFEEGKYKAAAEKSRRKIILMDKISLVSQSIDDIRIQLRENLFAVHQIFVCQNVKMNYEQETGLAKMFEMVLLNHKCDQTDFVQDIIEYYDVTNKVYETRKETENIYDELKQIVKQHGNRQLEKHLSSDHNDFINEKIVILTEKNEIAKLNKKPIIVECVNQKIIQEQHLKNVQILRELENNKKESLEDALKNIKLFKESIIIAKKLKDRKCNYAQHITDKVSTIIEEIKQYTTGKERLQLENLYYILKKMYPLIVHLKKIESKMCHY